MTPREAAGSGYQGQTPQGDASQLRGGRMNRQLLESGGLSAESETLEGRSHFHYRTGQVHDSNLFCWLLTIKGNRNL